MKIPRFLIQNTNRIIFPTEIKLIIFEKLSSSNNSMNKRRRKKNYKNMLKNNLNTKLTAL